MSQHKILSAAYNMSLGFIPIIVSMILSEYVTHNTAIYIGTIAGITATSLYRPGRQKTVPPLMLYASTVMLLLLSLLHLLMICSAPRHLYSITIEIAALLPALFFLIHRKFLAKRAHACHIALLQKGQKGGLLLEQAVEASIVSARIVVILAMLHLLALLCTLTFQRPLSETSRLWLLHILPPMLFILAILFNALSIHFFNKMMKETVLLPIVNRRGDVIGKCFAAECIHSKKYMFPVIRIAVIANGMIYLMPRPDYRVIDRDKHDILLESYLHFGETLEQAADRLLRHTFYPPMQGTLCFNIKYHFETPETERLVYLFMFELSDERGVSDPRLREAKPWTLQQIAQNLDKNYFSSHFEEEYELLKTAIYTREKYKES